MGGSNWEQVISSLGMTLVHFCWQAVIIAMSLKGVLVLSDKQSFNLRYYSALAALALCIMTPLYTFYHYYSELSSLDVQSIVQNTSVEYPIFVDRAMPTFEMVGQLAQVMPLNRGFELGEFLNTQFMVILWAIGVLCVLTKFSFEIYQTYRLTRVGVTSAGAELEDLVTRLSTRFNIKGRVTILKSSLVNTPVVIGWLKPSILIPFAISVGLDRQQLELIIAHELAHVKRLDFLVNLLQSAIQTIFFYHPCIYWINKVIREEREYICDALALSTLQNQPKARLELAKALLCIEELKAGNLSLVAVAASDGHLKNRINRIVTTENTYLPSAKGVLVMLAGMVFSLTAVAVTANFAGQRAVTFSSHSQVVSASSSVNNLKQVNDQQLIKAQNNKKMLMSSEQKIFLGNTLNESHFLGTSVFSTLAVDKDAVNIAQSKEHNLVKKVSSERKVVQLEKNNKKQNLEKKVPYDENQDNTLGGTLTSATLTKKRQEKVQQEKISELSIEVNNQVKVKSASEKNAQLAHTIEKVVDFHKKKHIPLPSKSLTKNAQLKIQKLALLEAAHVDVLVEPRAIRTPYPVYPANAYSNKLSGKVKVDFTIDKNGRVINPQFGEGTSWTFIKEIKSKLVRWRYRPAEKSGEKIAYHSSIYFDFELPDEEPLVRYKVGTRIKRKIR